MFEASFDKSIDSTSNDTFFTPVQSQPDGSFVHMMLQNKPSARREDELDTTEKRPALRLQMQQSTHALREDELDTTEKRPALRLQMQQSTHALREDQSGAPEECPVVRLEPMQQGMHALLKSKEFSTVRTLLYQWTKTNIVMLVNAGSLIGTTAVTSVLGFVFWWVAARWFPPEAVGLGSATISAMTLLGIVCMLGLGTLLVGELSRQPGKEGSLISAALIVVGGAGGCAGVVFALVAPFVAADFHVLRASVEDILLFAAGVSLTAITLVLDQALIGLLHGGLQLWRNTFFAVAKLAALFVVSLWLSHGGGLMVYTAWLVGSVLSLAVLTGFRSEPRERHCRSAYE